MKLPDWLKSHQRRFREETQLRIRLDLERHAGDFGSFDHRDYLPPAELWRNQPAKGQDTEGWQ